MMGIDTVLLWGLWFGSIAGVVSWIVAMTRDRRSAKQPKIVAQPVPTHPTSYPLGIRTPPPIQPDFNPDLANQLQNRVLLLVNGDTQKASQLIRHAQLAHPAESRQWVLAKVIAELEGDR